MKSRVVICLLVILPAALVAESLWQETFEGYIAGSSVFKAGDIVTIVIDSGFSLDFSSATKDAKSITFEFSGGEYGNLFTFLPQVRTGDDRSVSGKERYSMQTELAARVTEIDPTGKLLVTGTRVVQLSGKAETITVTGRLDPKTIDGSGRVNIAQIENARLTYTGLLDPQIATLTAQDIQEIVKEISGGETGTVTEQTTIELTDQKKRELILLYLNRLIDIIFR